MREAMAYLFQHLINYVFGSGPLAWLLTPVVLLGLVIRFLRWSHATARGEKDIGDLHDDISDTVEGIRNRGAYGTTYRSLRREGMNDRDISRARNQRSGSRFRWLWLLPLALGLVARPTYAQSTCQQVVINGVYNNTPGQPYQTQTNGYVHWLSGSGTINDGVGILHSEDAGATWTYITAVSSSNPQTGTIAPTLLGFTMGAQGGAVTIEICQDAPTATPTSAPTNTATATSTSMPTVTGTPPTSTPTSAATQTDTGVPTATITALPTIAALAGSDVMTAAGQLGETLPSVFWDGTHGNMFWALGALILGFFVMSFVGALVRMKWGE